MKTLKTKSEAGKIVQERLQGIFVREVTFTVDSSKITRQDGRWRVPIIPSEEPDRLFATYEELAILEGELHEEGYTEIILTLDEPSLKVAA
jgi:hypothetical protein